MTFGNNKRGYFLRIFFTFDRCEAFDSLKKLTIKKLTGFYLESPLSWSPDIFLCNARVS